VTTASAWSDVRPWLQGPQGVVLPSVVVEAAVVLVV